VLPQELPDLRVICPQGGKVLVLDSDGFVVDITDRLPEGNIPYVTGLKPSGYQQGRQLDTADGRVYAMKAVLEGLKRVNGTGYVSELDVELLNDLRITTRTGMTVLLGNSNDMLNKLTWMTGALTDLEARGERGLELGLVGGLDREHVGEAAPGAFRPYLVGDEPGDLGAASAHGDPDLLARALEPHGVDYARARRAGLHGRLDGVRLGRPRGRGPCGE